MMQLFNVGSTIRQTCKGSRWQRIALHSAPIGLLVVESREERLASQPRFPVLPLAAVLFLRAHLPEKVAEGLPEVFPDDGLESARGKERQERGELFEEVDRMGRVQAEVGLEERKDEGCWPSGWVVSISVFMRLIFG